MSTVAWPDHLLTLAEWEAMPEDTTHRLELVEGILLVAPRPTGRHQYAISELSHELNRQLRPKGLFAMGDVEVVIEAGFPPSVRVPDVIVVPEAVAKPDPPRYEAADVVLAVEIVSPGSGLTDRVTKRIQYAEAGIAHYWIIDLDPPVSLTGYLLVDGDYEVTVDGTGVVDVTSPAPLHIELDALTPFP
jgi:Uma2 family endonuclease